MFIPIEGEGKKEVINFNQIPYQTQGNITKQ
jgi:hypothetical protein